MTPNHNREPLAHVAGIDTDLSPLDIAVGYPLGSCADSDPLPSVPVGLTPRRALEELVIPALSRPPCLVSFSGGRDSSAVLAVATMVARREGLPLPIPVSMRFPAAPGTEESQWQEAVVSHLSLDDWVKLSFTDDLDFIGPIAQPVLRRHGLLSPPMAYLYGLIMTRAPGGSMLTGFYGDLVFGNWRYSGLSQLWRGQTAPGKGHVRQAVAALTPAALRPRLLSSPLARKVAWVSWLTPRAKERYLSLHRSEWGTEPVRWNHRAGWLSARRHIAMMRRSLGLIAHETDTRAHHPLIDPLFLSSLAEAGGWRGLGDRTAMMEALFGDLLPPALVRRSTKADLTFAYWCSYARRFAEHWDGHGVDREVVDVARLREVWCGDRPIGATGLLLQQAWLATQSRGSRASYPPG